MEGAARRLAIGSREYSVEALPTEIRIAGPKLMGKTLQMFDRPRIPRVVRMHVIDAGLREDGAEIAVYRCSRCRRETDWTEFRTITEAKRGIPCPACNSVTEFERT